MLNFYCKQRVKHSPHHRKASFIDTLQELHVFKDRNSIYSDRKIPTLNIKALKPKISTIFGRISQFFA
jgi:hypothetical protein